FDEQASGRRYGVLALFALFVDNLQAALRQHPDGAANAGNNLLGDFVRGFRLLGEVTLRDDGTRGDAVAILHQGLTAGRHLVLLDEGIDVRDADDAAIVLGNDLHDSVGLTDDGLALGGAGLEQLFDAGKTAGDVGL